MELVLGLGVEPHHIIFAHPVKSPAQIRWAASAGINLTTFDTAAELDKIARYHSSTGVLCTLNTEPLIVRKGNLPLSEIYRNNLDRPIEQYTL